MIGVIGATLILIVTDCGNGCHKESKYPMESIESCSLAVQQARFAIASGGDAESSVVILCVDGDRS